MSATCFNRVSSCRHDRGRKQGTLCDGLASGCAPVTSHFTAPPWPPGAWNLATGVPHTVFRSGRRERSRITSPGTRLAFACILGSSGCRRRMYGAGSGNRTRTTSLEGWGATITPYPLGNLSEYFTGYGSSRQAWEAAGRLVHFWTSPACSTKAIRPFRVSLDLSNVCARTSARGNSLRTQHGVRSARHWSEFDQWDSPSGPARFSRRPKRAVPG